jgi:outer membrane receptor protein involved in Fe transport
MNSRQLFAVLGLLLAAGSLIPLRAAEGDGSVIGTIFDAANGQPIREAKITVDGRPQVSAVTDVAGKYRLVLPPGTYVLKITAAKYFESVIDEVTVAANGVAEASTVLALRTIAERVEVNDTASPAIATAEAMLVERKLSPVVSDAISTDDLRKSTASDAAGALQQVTGVSLVDGGFVYVRGLGERYSASMLNSALLPTTEPEKRVVPLDLFPASLIDNIKLLKTYTPDLPAEFSGGLVQMNTIEFPAAPMLRVSTKSGFNTRTTFGRFLTYPGGGTDFFGFDRGTRGLPSSIPSDARLFPGKFTQQQLQTFGQAFANNWETTPIGSMRPALDWSVVGGGTFGRVGLVGALTFHNAPQVQNEIQRYFRQGGTAPVVFTDYPEFREDSERARLGGVLNVALRLNPNHKLVFRNTFTHDTEKSARRFSGYDGGVDSFIESERLRWVERGLLSTSVEGDHSFPKLRQGLFHWQLTYSRSTRHEPDLREVFRGLLPDGRYIFSAFGSSGIRFFSNLEDRIYEPQADFSLPFFKGPATGILKAGFRATIRSRDFDARRFRYIPQSGRLDLFLPSNRLFAPENIRPDGFQILEFTRGTDRYTANLDLYAGYAMADVALGRRWRIVGGVRMESSDQRVNTIDNAVPNATPATASLQNLDAAPAVNVIYALTSRQNLRFAASRTISRPDFRELSPFDFNNVLGGFVVQGNPNLRRATIENLDVRWESFPGASQVLAASFFYKRFRDPIEQTVLPANDLRQTFVNAKGARNIGVELEVRRGLRSLHSKLSGFSVAGNFTFVDSTIDIAPEDAALLTSKSRPLLGQSRYIVNLVTEWAKPAWRSDARFFVNHVSRRISDVGTFRMPDIYQEGATSLDFNYQYSFTEKGKWVLRFEAENLLDKRYRWTQGGLLQRQYQTGRTFQVGLSYAIF